MIKVLNKDIDERKLYRQKCYECDAELRQKRLQDKMIEKE